MRQPEEIRELIAKIGRERVELMSEYAVCNSHEQQGILAAVLIEKSFAIKHLKWVLEES